MPNRTTARCPEANRDTGRHETVIRGRPSARKAVRSDTAPRGEARRKTARPGDGPSGRSSSRGQALASACHGGPLRSQGRAAISGRPGVTAKQGPDLRLPEPPVPAGSPYAADPPRRRPAGDRLRVYPEERSDLSRSEQSLTVAVHLVYPSRSPIQLVLSVATNMGFILRFRKIWSGKYRISHNRRPPGRWRRP